jgi:putative nucleotidyltransferase with HDIG domain
MTDKRSIAVVNILILAMTMLIVAGILVLGRADPPEEPPALAVGQPSPETFVANRNSSPITDEEATRQAQQQAGLEVTEIFTTNPEAELATLSQIAQFYEDLAAGAFAPLPPEFPTTTTTIEETTTSSTEAPPEEEETTTTTTTTTVAPTTTTTTIPRRDLVEQADLLAAIWPTILRTEIENFVLLFNSDLDRVLEEEAESVFSEVVSETQRLASQEFERGIREGELVEVQSQYLTSPPAIFIPGLPVEEQPIARSAIAELLARMLRANLVVDVQATEEAKQERIDAVAPVTVVYPAFQPIAVEGDTLDEFQVEAINELGLYNPVIEFEPSPWAIALLGTIAVMLAAFFLWRIAPTQWNRPQHYLLLGILLVLAALAARLPELIATDNTAIGYVMPAAMIGVMAAILFDPRTALLMAVPMAGFTAIATQDLAYTVFAAAATVIPVAFVSSASSRRQLRLAGVGSAAAIALVAGAVEWMFRGPDQAFEAAAWAFLGALVGTFVGQGLVSFLETAFGVTTTLGLLDLLDRNHPALRLLEEKAPGTFNHSTLVGSLAGRAAGAIEADPLLAQAAALYHDLGKTENPQYFVENQVGVSNPHDRLPPEQSAVIIRAHVTDGLRLAKRYRIPSDVANGIRMHHGTSLMRYFYHEALSLEPDVDPTAFRHHGTKPTRKEMAIVMISDAVEAAARAYAQEEDPTAEGLERLVDTIVNEKLDDGQLDHSDLTFGELTRVKQELVMALAGYYHARIPYPGFPGPQVIEGSQVLALPDEVEAAEDVPESEGEGASDADEEEEPAPSGIQR